MASLRTHPNSPYFVACFIGTDGQRYQRSTKVRSDGRVESRRKAQRIANEFEDVARKLRTAQQAQTVIQHLYLEATGTPLLEMTSRKFTRAWLDGKRGSVDTKTHSAYERLLDSFLLFLTVRADGSLHLIGEKDVSDWRDQEAARVSPTTANFGLKVLRMFLGDACKRDLIGTNPSERVPILKKTQAGSPRRPFTMEEIQQLLPHLTPEWRGIVLFGLYTGLRLGDVIRLKWADIDLQAGEVRCITKKTGRAQKIPIAPPLLRHLESIPRPIRSDLPVHPAAAATAASQRGSVSTLSRQFHDFMAKAGLVPKRTHQKREDQTSSRRQASPLTFHGLRHTLTSLLKNAGVSSAIAEEIVGHNSSEMNRIYTHIEQASLAKAMGQLPDVGN